jgi:hypothetical protein
MAQLTKSVLGRVSGKLGDITFRQRNGKNIIGLSPGSYTPPDDQASIDRRVRFTFSSKLAKAILAVPELSVLWKPFTPQGMSEFNFIIQKNILLINPGAVSDITMIAPTTGFGINCTSSTISAEAIAAELAAIGAAAGIVPADEPNVKLAFVLSLTKPVNLTFPEFSFISGTTAAAQTVLDTPLSFTLPLVGEDSMLVESYEEKKILLALITLDAAGKPVRYSGTVVK